ncbi:acetoacetate--CoA ligase [Pseudahrensia aquimaris]|uniref:Acetoacetate--CoA ligase n=1 Tax=Pseudahrensia aquimaris TaxID=744461 RepID=A0ABW3FF16_9HYPH
MTDTTAAKRQPLWTPDAKRVSESRLSDFARFVAERTGETFNRYDALHAWSIGSTEAFWTAIWDYCELRGERGERTLMDGDKMPGAKFFPDAKLNYAENMLAKKGNDRAIVFRGEDKVRMEMTWDELHALVSRLQQAFADAGVTAGDRIAAMVPNHPHTLACMLAANSIGAIWSSCSPDFGEQGVLDRFSQIEPTLFIACDAYWYNGKRIDVSQKVAAVAPQLTARQTVVIDYLDSAESVAQAMQNASTLDAFIAPFTAKEVNFERLPFDHPLYILFSSGTTGIPKCIVHSQGGILLQHAKEHALHCNIKEGDRVFYFTTCGWMMWNWLVSALVMKATIMLYDGSPFYPDGAAVFDYVSEEKITFFGTSAKFIDAVRNEGRRPIDTHDLSHVEVIASTGSPLAPENFAYAYEAIKRDVHLASVSGGTDIAACFVGAVPWQPVYSGEIQGPVLGMATEVWDEDGRDVRQQKGELVCVQPFPSMPVGFWNDPDGRKYHEAYFDRYDNVWCHGDFAEWTDTGGMIIHGRSDATLNPGGVRIGTAEIYNQVEQMPEIEEALCIGQQWESDTRVVLFVRLAQGFTLDDELKAAIKLKIRNGASPRHVPAVIVAVADIPRTKSGKITELAVRDIVHGRSVKNQEALANPEALKLFENLSELS